MEAAIPLTDTFVRQVKHRQVPAGEKHADGMGMYLLVKPSGKYWRMDYAFAGKRRTLAVGVYPRVSLANARRERDRAKQLLADGVDPGLAKRVAKAEGVASSSNTFELVARELHATKTTGWSRQYGERWIEKMEKDLFPRIGSFPLKDLTAPILLAVLRKVEARGAHETAHTLRQTAGQVFRYGIQTGRCERNLAADLHGALKPVAVTHMSAVLDPTKAGELLRAIDGYSGQLATKVALQLSALLFQRPGNIRQMEWKWVDLDHAVLTIPSENMKRTIHQKVNGRPHFVPLAAQAITALRELKLLTGHGRYVFPSLRTGERPMSENTINAALRRMGFAKEEMTAHGFRAMARTLIVEQLPGISGDVIEAQLAHGKSGPLGMAYDRAEFMEQRRKMMATWANYLERLAKGDQIVSRRSRSR